MFTFKATAMVLQKSQILKKIPRSELEKLMQRLRNNIQSMLKCEYGVLSLSAKNDDILMWSHYADYHKGFCIEFKRSLDNPRGSIQPVQYVREYPSFNYFDDLPGNIAKRIILTKADNWSYEEEWRGIQKANNIYGSGSTTFVIEIAELLKKKKYGSYRNVDFEKGMQHVKDWLCQIGYNR